MTELLRLVLGATGSGGSTAGRRAVLQLQWSTASSTSVLAARLPAVNRALRALLGAQIHAQETTETEAAALAREAAETANTAGRPLAGANADLPWPDEPHLQLWHAATVLREHRGDGYFTALIAVGLDPWEALVSFAATGANPSRCSPAPAGRTRNGRSRDRLHERDWLDSEGQATKAVAKHRADLEQHADELASGPWRALGTHGAARLAQLTAPLTRTIATSGICHSRAPSASAAQAEITATQSRADPTTGLHNEARLPNAPRERPTEYQPAQPRPHRPGAEAATEHRKKPAI